MEKDLARTDRLIMEERIRAALKDSEILEVVRVDFEHILKQGGLHEEWSEMLVRLILEDLKWPHPLSQIENSRYNFFRKQKIYPANDLPKKAILEFIQEALSERLNMVYERAKDHLKGVRGRIIDFSIGYGNTNVPDKYYEAGMAIMILSHEKENEKVLEELNRTVRRKLVVIEPVPNPNSSLSAEKELERTFMIEYFCNRILRNENIPVPGNFETKEDWPKRFAPYGWECTYNEYLEHPSKNLQNLYVFER